MARYKRAEYSQLEIIPLSFEDQIIKGSFEHTLYQLIEKADLKEFDTKYNNNQTGSKAIPPRVLYKSYSTPIQKGSFLQDEAKRMKQDGVNNTPPVSGGMRSV